VLRKEECLEIIRLTEEHCYKKQNGWQTDRHKIYKTVDIDVRHVPELLSLCNSRLAMDDNFMPGILHTLAYSFQVNVKDLIVQDLFVVKYSVGNEITNQTSLPPHQDDSVLSFVISLNDHGTNEETEYIGGGTEFVNWKQKLDSDTSDRGEYCMNLTKENFNISKPLHAGTMTSFCGLQLHAGKQIVQGVRYILAGFLKVDNIEIRKLAERFYPYPHGR
jgi:hypothetical protein